MVYIDTYSFSIRETTIRNWAIGIGITLGILLVLCLIAIQVLRTKIKRLKKERDVYVGKLNGVFVHKGVKYEAVEPGVLEGGGLVVQRAELGSEEVFESGGRGRAAYATDFPKIQGLPEVKHARPFTGHLGAVGGRRQKNDATVYLEWAEELQTDVFQCRLGNQRTVVVNSWQAMKDLWISHSHDLSDRPDQPGFVEKLGVDITGTSMTDQIRRCRASAMRALGKPNWSKYYHLVEPTSVSLIRDMYQRGQNGKLPMDIYYHLRHVVFDLALSLTYGARFGEVHDSFMTKFLWSINTVSAVRNSTKTYRHFVPLLRWIPESTSEIIKAEKVRSQHIDVLYTNFKNRVAAGETVDCILSSLKNDKLTEPEIHGTCISLLQAAPDTVASGIYQCIAWLTTPSGQIFQEDVHAAILAAYSNDRTAAWNHAFREERVPLPVSLYKETLRFFTVAPFSIPRKASKDIYYRDFVIPKGMTFILNSQQVSHDEAHFGDDAWNFDPRRGRKPSVHPINFSDVYSQVISHPRFFDCCFEARDPEWLETVTAGEK
ncbi:hypothetical protein PRZ48_012432 [Zasmidium cellare]|uniref:Cytochrome P450 n=1 Tax=Zasmidium cellare TaxID=395010 RepID=A0ABR0E4U3_ZASCE|nr:hypothetical protein PRZ48_012432 [Zasmidium cellare]